MLKFFLKLSTDHQLPLLLSPSLPITPTAIPCARVVDDDITCIFALVPATVPLSKKQKRTPSFHCHAIYPTCRNHTSIGTASVRVSYTTPRSSWRSSTPRTPNESNCFCTNRSHILTTIITLTTFTRPTAPPSSPPKTASTSTLS